VNPWISSFLDKNHELSDEEFSNYEAGETFMQQLIANIGTFLTPFKTTLTVNNYSMLINHLTSEVAKQLEKVPHRFFVIF